MGLNEQFQKIKDNWMIILIVVVVLVLPNFFTGITSIANYSRSSYDSYSSSGGYGAAYEISQKSYSGMMPPIYDNRNFAPDEANRKIMKTVTLSNEVKRGTYTEEEEKLKEIIKISNSFLLNENVNKYGEDNNQYRVGSYTIKVEASKYDAVISQLKMIGEVKAFSEVKEDITGQYSNAKIELETEKSRLERHNQMYKEATLVADKITLNDMIFNQERTIKYMQDSIDNMDTTVEYSTVYFTLTEKRSEYAQIMFVKFSELVRGMVESLNSMLHFVFVLLPWAVVLSIIAFIVKKIKHKKK